MNREPEVECNNSELAPIDKIRYIIIRTRTKRTGLCEDSTFVVTIQ
jgi:hypothetical protein